MIVLEHIGFEKLDMPMGEGPMGEIGFSLRKTVKKVGKKAKKGLVKAAPVLAIAAQALNFVVPGLGIAVGLALTTGVAALKAKDAKKEMAKQEKAASQEEAAAVAAQEVELSQQANQQMDAAYLKGEPFFAQRYGMTREKFTALPLEQKTKFLQGVIYDQQSGQLQTMGVSREKFLSLPVEEQNRVLAAVVQPFPWLTISLIGGGVLLAGIAAFLFLRK